jgi:outer membrane protein assembly factor BamA
MDQAWDTLEDIGYFAFVDMEYEEDDDGQVTWRIMVEEDLTTAYGPLVRYDRRHKYRLGAWLEENNLRGKGEVFKASMAFLYAQRAEVSWYRPWLFNVEGMDATLRLHGQHGDFVFRPTRHRQYQGDLEVRWVFRAPFFAKVGVNFGQDDYRDGYTWALPDRGQGSPGLAEFLPGQQTRTALSGAVGLDTRDNLWYPSQGVMIEAGARRWQSGDFDSYTETRVDARFFAPMPVGQHVLVGRAFGRRVDGPAHLDNVLFYGGPETIRGYRFGGLEGDEGYLLSLEYRIPLFMMPISPRGEMVGVGLHAFADAGDAWYEGAEAGRALQSYGAGIHLNLDTLQLRFEAAKPREGDWRFEFMDVFNF